MKTKKVFSYFLLAISFFLFYKGNVMAAGSADVIMTAPSSVYLGKNIDVIISVKNLRDIPGGIAGVGAAINFDSSSLEFVNSSSLSSYYTIRYTSGKIAGFAIGDNIVAPTNLIKLTFRTKKVGKTTISMSSPQIVDGNAQAVSFVLPSVMINITDPPSSNANLSSLSVSSGSINFNKDTTNYSVNVDSNVTSINVSASAEDSGAKISGTGSKNLNYGNNTIKVVVTAPSGATKTYTVSVNRKDNRSNNNNLSSLTVSNGSIRFNKNTTTYNMEVPFDTASINVSASAEDNKARVSGTGNKNLAAGKNNTIKITVTAENGSTKTYTINVRRGADPNKEQSKDNNLTSLKMKDAKLSPEFNKDILEYSVTVPYSVKKAEFEYTLSDKEFASVKLDNPERLKIGENKITLTVIAENGDEKKYTITITRETSPDGVLDPEDMPSNEPVNGEEEEKEVFGLKDIVLKNGKLKTKFDAKTHVYKYKKNKNFSYEALKNNEDDSLEIFEEKGVITIILENSNGEKAVYTLIPEESDIVPIIVGGISVVLIGGGTYLGYLKGLKNNKIKKKKSKSKESLA